MKPHHREEDEGPPGAWVLASYHLTHWNASLSFVLGKDGQPKADWHDTSSPSDAYRWNSYHAARKFQRAHPKLEGYVILNLTELQQRTERQRAAREDWIHGRRRDRVEGGAA
jgi:hypothetical protein